MKIYLAKKVRVIFPKSGYGQRVHIPIREIYEDIYVRSKAIPVTLTPANVNHHEEITKLEEKLVETFSSKTGGSQVLGHSAGPWKVVVDVGVYRPRSQNINRSSSKVKGFLRVRDHFSTRAVLKGLSQIYGDREIKLTVQVENFRDTFQSDDIDSPQEMSITEKDVVCNTNLSPLSDYKLEKGELIVNDNIRVNEWKNNDHQSRWKAYVTIIAVVPDDAKVEPCMPDKWCMNKKLLLEQLCTDATIVANNGVGIKCHKVFLAVHSSVLAAMFQTGMQESQTSTVEMPDMSEASVRAFLDYLYCWETKEAEADNNSLICFELFAAGHKYDISQLENYMGNVLLQKSCDWFDVDVAVHLYLFSRNLPNGDKLKMKAIQVLKTKRDLNKSSSYQQLFTDDPKAAMELCENAFAL